MPDAVSAASDPLGQTGNGEARRVVPRAVVLDAVVLLLDARGGGKGMTWLAVNGKMVAWRSSQSCRGSVTMGPGSKGKQGLRTKAAQLGMCWRQFSLDHLSLSVDECQRNASVFFFLESHTDSA